MNDLMWDLRWRQSFIIIILFIIRAPAASAAIWRVNTIIKYARGLIAAILRHVTGDAVHRPTAHAPVIISISGHWMGKAEIQVRCGGCRFAHKIVFNCFGVRQRHWRRPYQCFILIIWWRHCDSWCFVGIIWWRHHYNITVICYASLFYAARETSKPFTACTVVQAVI